MMSTAGVRTPLLGPVKYGAWAGSRPVKLGQPQVNAVNAARGAHLGVVDKRGHVAGDARRALLGVSQAVTQAAVDDGHDERLRGE